MKREKKEKHFIKKPVYAGGLKAMRQFIRENLQYPEEAIIAKVEGTVALKYTIDHKGKVIGSKIISPLGYGCDEEAVRLVKLLRFEVAKNRTGRILFHKNIQIHFRLSDLPETGQVNRTSINYNISTQSVTESNRNNQEAGKKSYYYSIPLPSKNETN